LEVTPLIELFLVKKFIMTEKTRLPTKEVRGADDLFLVSVV